MAAGLEHHQRAVEHRRRAAEAEATEAVAEAEVAKAAPGVKAGAERWPGLLPLEPTPTEMMLFAAMASANLPALKVSGLPGWSSGLIVFPTVDKVWYGAFVWARWALNIPKRRFLVRAVGATRWRSRRLS